MRTLTRSEGDATPGAQPSHRDQRRVRFVRGLTVVAAVTLVVWLMSALALVLYTRGSRDATVRELIIPAGTNELIAAGQNPLEIPDTWSFFADDTLVLVNQDRVDHRLGGC